MDTISIFAVVALALCGLGLLETFRAEKRSCRRIGTLLILALFPLGITGCLGTIFGLGTYGSFDGKSGETNCQGVGVSPTEWADAGLTAAEAEIYRAHAANAYSPEMEKYKLERARALDTEIKEARVELKAAELGVASATSATVAELTSKMQVLRAGLEGLEAEKASLLTRPTATPDLTLPAGLSRLGMGEYKLGVVNESDFDLSITIRPRASSSISLDLRRSQRRVVRVPGGEYQYEARRISDGVQEAWGTKIVNDIRGDCDVPGLGRVDAHLIFTVR